jgi:hypothetical protein
MDKTRSAIGRSRSSFAQTDRYSGPRTLALRAGLGRTAADTLRLVKKIKASEEYLLLLICQQDSLTAQRVTMTMPTPISDRRLGLHSPQTDYGARSTCESSFLLPAPQPIEDRGNICEAQSVWLHGGHFEVTTLRCQEEDTNERNGPAWVHKTDWFGAMLSDDEIWQIVSLVKHSQDLSASVEAESGA